MSKYVRGLKRQQIINRWIQGHDDPDYEVFPTKKEGKYIVKKRMEPLEQSVANVDANVDTDTAADVDTDVEYVPEPVKKVPRSKTAVKTVPRAVPQNSNSDMTLHSSDVQGIGIEILEHLKLLGQEMKHQRKKKEQKDAIKHIVQKQLIKHPGTGRKYIKDPDPDPDSDNDSDPDSDNDSDPDSETSDTPMQPQPAPVFRSRIRNPLI